MIPNTSNSQGNIDKSQIAIAIIDIIRRRNKKAQR